MIIKTYEGISCDDTGVAGLTVYCNNIKICNIGSIVAPSFPVHINGFDQNLVSEFDIDSTLIPGLTRFITDEASGNVVFKLVYIDQGI